MRLSLSPFQRQLLEWLRGRQPHTPELPDVVWAAVAVIVVPDPDAVLIIRRAERSGDPWSGHMGLPGGRRQRDDPDLLSTAMRETLEEVGLPLLPDSCLGALDVVSPRSPTAPRVAVQPFLFALAGRDSLSPNQEVSLAMWIPLRELREPGVYRPISLELRGEVRSFPAYHLGQHVIWGMTERILTPLLELVP